jgi:hypothetical protein
MINKLIQELKEDNWFGGPFEMELLEFTRANRIEKERAIQKARSRGKDQKGVDKERKSTERSQEKREESANPWKNVVIVKTLQDGKTRLIPRSDFEPGRHELLYGAVSGQPPKPEVTPNVAREISQQDGFEPSKTSNRLLGIQRPKKRAKEEVVRSDHYDYPRDGVQRVDPTSTYPDWDHSVESMAQGISLVANSTGGKQVDIATIRQFFGQSSTLMDASIRAYQQLGEIIPGQMMIQVPDAEMPVAGPWAELTGGMDSPTTDLIIQDERGNVYCVAIINDKLKVIATPEADTLFKFILQQTMQQLEQDEQTAKRLQKFKNKVQDFISGFNKENSLQKKYLYLRGEGFKSELISDLEEIFEGSDVFETAMVAEALTGQQKFGGQMPGMANALMSQSKDGTNLKFTPINQTTIKRLIGETYLKIKLMSDPMGSAYDEMYQILMSDNQQMQASALQQQAQVEDERKTSITEFFNITEGVSDAKMYFDNFMSQQPSALLGFLSFFGLSASNIVLRNINLDAVGSLTTGDFNKVKVNGNTFYIGIEKEVDFYDGKAIRLGEERDYKKEYREYHSKPEQKKRRAGRNNARRKAERDGKVEKGDGKDIDHKDHNPLNNSSKNTRVRDRSENRGDNKVPVREEYGAGEEGTTELLLRYLMDTPYMSIPKEFITKGKSYAAQRRRTEKGRRP